MQMKPSLHVNFGFAPDEHKKFQITADHTVPNAAPLSSLSSSSIGQASDSSSSSSSPKASAEEKEVQSSFRSPLNNMSSLEDSLPIKRGLSNFFKGKSRSFTSFADVSSISDLVKRENPYAKKRKWLHGDGSASRNRTGHPPLCHSLSGAPKKFLTSRDRDNLSHFSSGSGSAGTSSDIPNVVKGFKARQKHSAPPRSLSLSDLQESGR